MCIPQSPLRAVCVLLLLLSSLCCRNKQIGTTYLSPSFELRVFPVLDLRDPPPPRPRCAFRVFFCFFFVVWVSYNYVLRVVFVLPPGICHGMLMAEEHGLI